MAEQEREDREIAAILPTHLKLYDFGDGVTTMPVPDFSGEGTYLTTSIALVHDAEEKRFLGFIVSFKKRASPPKSIINSTDFLERLAEAVKNFDEQATESAEAAMKKATSRKAA